MLRAIFVADWHPADPLPFADRATLTREAQAVRPHHNQTPDHIIGTLARVLRRPARRSSDMSRPKRRQR